MQNLNVGDGNTVSGIDDRNPPRFRKTQWSKNFKKQSNKPWKKQQKEGDNNSKSKTGMGYHPQQSVAGTHLYIWVKGQYGTELLVLENDVTAEATPQTIEFQISRPTHQPPNHCALLSLFPRCPIGANPQSVHMGAFGNELVFLCKVYG